MIQYYLFKGTLLKRDAKGVYFLLYSKTSKRGLKAGTWVIINEKWVRDAMGNPAYVPIPQEEAERLETLIRL